MPTSHRPRTAPRLVAAAAALLLATPLGAAVRTWDGDGATDSWQFRSALTGITNWTDIAPPGVSYPLAGDSLVFAGTRRLSTVNDAVDLSLAGISFADAAGAFTLGGQGLRLTGGVVNRSSVLQTVALGLRVDATQVWDGGTAGLRVTGPLSLGPGYSIDLTLDRKVTIDQGSSTLDVGSVGGPTFHQLVVQGGSRVLMGDSRIGLVHGGSAYVTVSGSGSSWEAGGTLNVAALGSGELRVDQGASLRSASASIAYDTHGGLVHVLGAGSSWHNDDQLFVGGASLGELRVADGARLFNGGDLLISSTYAYQLTTASFVGAGTQAQVGGEVWVGQDSTMKGRLRVEDGATLDSAWGRVVAGQAAVSRGGRWTVAERLSVGDLGTGAGTLSVVETGVVQASSAWINGGSATVADPGSLLQVGGPLTVGLQRNATLTVYFGGTLRAGSLVLARDQDSVSWIYASDAGRIEVAGAIDLGGQGTGTLWLERGASMSSGDARVGVQSLNIGSAGSGTVYVRNPGSRWDVTGSLAVGVGAPGALTIENGGTVTHGAASVGSFAAGAGGVSVSGTGALWSGSGALVLGGQGVGTLTVDRGAQALHGSAVLGEAASGRGSANIEGAGTRWTLQQTLQVGGNGRGTLAVKDGAELSVGGALSVGTQGQLTLAGGSLSAASASRASGGQFSWTAGRLALGSAQVGPADSLLAPTLVLGATQTLATTAGDLRVDPGALLVLQGGRVEAAQGLVNRGSVFVTAGGALQADVLRLEGGALVLGAEHRLQARELQLAGGSLTAPRLAMDDIGLLQGRGTVSAALAGGAASTVRASGGSLVLGDAAAADGFSFAGLLDVGTQRVTLLDADRAELGNTTLLAGGGRLEAGGAGMHLRAGTLLSYTGQATVDGIFVNDGAVQAGAPGARLRFEDAVSGNGSFSGNIVFGGGYSPGHGPTGLVGFGGGDVAFDAPAVLTLAIGGGGHDRLGGIGLLDFHGRLELVFESGYVPADGERIDLLDFAGFAGQLDASVIDVRGFDGARLDFSRLALDGTLGMAVAVPEPETCALLLAGLLAVGLKLRGARRE